MSGGSEHDGHTFDVGYVHILTEVGGECRDDCRHPDHAGVS